MRTSGDLRARWFPMAVGVVGLVALGAGCAADKAIEEGTDCDQECPVGAQVQLAKEASGSCGADGSYKELGAVEASGKCSGSGECQVVCMYPKCGVTQTLKITRDAFICEATSDKCATVDCDGHGDCRVVNDAAVCECDVGYETNGIHCDPVQKPVVSIITPSTAKVGVETSFTIVGQRMPDTIVVEVEQCTGLAFTFRSAETQVFVCTPEIERVAAHKVLAEDGSKLYEDEVTFVLECTDCEIGGVCYSDKDPNPDKFCEECDSAVDAGGWTFKPGKACDDGQFCNGPGVCSTDTGTCQQLGMPCAEDGVFCNGSELDGCNETKDVCESPGSPCDASQWCSEVDEACLDEVVANVAVSNPQRDPKVSTWADGSFVVAWISYEGTNNYRLVARVFEKWGVPKGQDIVLQELGGSNIDKFDMESRADGSFAVAWGQKGAASSWTTKVRVFDGEGVPMGEANSFSAAGFGEPNLAVYPGGAGFVVVQGMKDDGAQSSETHWIWGQEFNQYGVSVAPAVKLNQQSSSNTAMFTAALADVAVNSKQNKAFAWFAYDEGLVGDEMACIRLRTHALTGMPSGPGYSYCLGTVGDFPVGVALAADEDFNLYVVWSAEFGAHEEQIYMAWQSEGSTDAGEMLTVSQYPEGRQLMPAVAAMSQGAMVVWASRDQDGDEYGVFARRVAGDGSFPGEEFQVNVKTGGDQTAPSVAPLGNNAAIIVWEGDAGLDSDIYMKKVVW